MLKGTGAKGEGRACGRPKAPKRWSTLATQPLGYKIKSTKQFITE